MSECRIISHVVPAGPPYYANGPMVLSHQCATHGISMPGVMSQLPGQEIMCPIGRVEKAVEEGIAKIEAALKREPIELV